MLSDCEVEWSTMKNISLNFMSKLVSKYRCGRRIKILISQHLANSALGEFYFWVAKIDSTLFLILIFQ